MSNQLAPTTAYLGQLVLDIFHLITIYTTTIIIISRHLMFNSKQAGTHRRPSIMDLPVHPDRPRRRRDHLSSYVHRWTVVTTCPDRTMAPM